MSTLGRILCAVDLEKASERAFERALSLAVIGHAKLFILHVVPRDVRYSSRAAERLQYLTELRERAKAAGLEVRVEEQQGDPIRVIVLHANARKVDIVVLGSNQRRGWRRLREGSVAESVCDVRPGRFSLCLGMLERVCSVRNRHALRQKGDSYSRQSKAGRHSKRVLQVDRVFTRQWE